MPFLAKKTAKSIPLQPASAESLKKQDQKTRAWAEASGFTGAPGTVLALPGKDGQIERVLFGLGAESSPYTFAALPGKLPLHAAGYWIDAKLDAGTATDAAFGWALGCYQFARYLPASKHKKFPALVWPEKADKAYATSAAEATFLVRDLINTPPNDLGPAELAQAAKKIAGKSPVKVIVGDDLLKRNYPAIHAVGKGSPRAPRLIDFAWGNPKNPKVTLVGKGVCFDTGGLNIKPGTGVAGMGVQKKDMGGAAHVLGLAQMIMAAKLPVRLRVLIPAVENSVDGACFRPSDIINTRKGLTVEVDNTDAEGRLILCDALAEACTEKPALIIDYATLTGAARVALGPDVPPIFSNDDKTARDFVDSGNKVHDPLWHLPLWRPYFSFLDSKIADLQNSGSSGFGGAITAALFLDRFVDKDIPWLHVDTYGWTLGNRPGRPEGGEARGMLAAYELIKTKFGK